jgi:hypothetical protein
MFDWIVVFLYRVEVGEERGLAKERGDVTIRMSHC